MQTVSEPVKKVYRYSGAVLLYDQVAAHNWVAETSAISKKKAESNLRYRFLKELGREKGTVKFPDQIKEKK